MSFPTFDTKKFPRNAAGYVLKQPIGKGSQAVVWLARCLTTDEEVAIKIIDLMNCTSHIDGFRVSKYTAPNYPNIHHNNRKKFK